MLKIGILNNIGLGLMKNTSKNLLAIVLFAGALSAQSAGPQSPSNSPVTYSSMSQLNALLSEVQQATQAIQADLAKTRVDKWKTDGGNKRQAQSDVESMQRNLQTALPELMSKLQNAPESLPDTFRLYRNLDALSDVFGSVVESTGAFGSKDDFQALQNDLSMLERSRRDVADRMDSLATEKENEIARLRSDLRNAQAASPPAAPKKVIVDDTEPPKKPAGKKKSTSKKSVTTPPPSQTGPQ